MAGAVLGGRTSLTITGEMQQEKYIGELFTAEPNFAQVVPLQEQAEVEVAEPILKQVQVSFLSNIQNFLLNIISFLRNAIYGSY